MSRIRVIEVTPPRPQPAADPHQSMTQTQTGDNTFMVQRRTNMGSAIVVGMMILLLMGATPAILQVESFDYLTRGSLQTDPRSPPYYDPIMDQEETFDPPTSHEHENEMSFIYLKQQFEHLGAFIHPDLTIQHSDATKSNGIFTRATLANGTRLLEIPNSLALTPDVAYESMSPYFSPPQLARLMNLQADHTCGLIDWFVVLYVAFSVAQFGHPVLFHLNNPLETLELSHLAIEEVETLWSYRTCASGFFPVFEGQTFSSKMHAAWSRMIEFYPATCTTLVCQPKGLVLELLNTPLLLNSYHSHIGCISTIRDTVEDVLEAINNPPTHLPIISYELLIWATSMVISRQQSIVPYLNSHERMPALVPFFDLFNSYSFATDQSDPHVYRPNFVESSELTKFHHQQPAIQAITQGEFPSGSEIFDLYGGGFSSTNVDLLTFFGYSVPDLPTDHLSLVLSVCTDVGIQSNGTFRQLQEGVLSRMEKFFDSAPLSLDGLWEEKEKERFRYADAPTKKITECVHHRLYQSTISPTGVSITLPILSRLAVANQQQLKDRSLVQKLFSGIPTLTRKQERTGLILLLHWLKSAEKAARAEWTTLRCHRQPHSGLTFPAIPTMTPEQEAMIQLPIEVLWRHPLDAALDYLLDSLDKDELATRQTNFLFHPGFHGRLCTLKLNHRHLLIQAATQLSTFLD